MGFQLTQNDIEAVVDKQFLAIERVLKVIKGKLESFAMEKLEGASARKSQKILTNRLASSKKLLAPLKGDNKNRAFILKKPFLKPLTHLMNGEIIRASEGSLKLEEQRLAQQNKE